jgi:uncharacterized protein YndB with AHSA1/START domain
MITESTVSSEIVTINAPAQLVWEILTDFENYGLWNSFCPQIKAELVMGSPVDMMTDLGNGLQNQVEYITAIEPNKLISWSMKNEPGDPVHACRTQWLESIGENQCTYLTTDEFSGEAMPAMMQAFSQHIEKGFNRCAQGLKARAEELVKP